MATKTTKTTTTLQPSATMSAQLSDGSVTSSDHSEAPTPDFDADDTSSVDAYYAWQVRKIAEWLARRVSKVQAGQLTVGQSPVSMDQCNEYALGLFREDLFTPAEIKSSYISRATLEGDVGMVPEHAHRFEEYMARKTVQMPALPPDGSVTSSDHSNMEVPALDGSDADDEYINTYYNWQVRKIAEWLKRRVFKVRPGQLTVEQSRVSMDQCTEYAHGLYRQNLICPAAIKHSDLSLATLEGDVGMTPGHAYHFEEYMARKRAVGL